MIAEKKDYITLNEAAQRSGISVDRLRRLIKAGRLQTLQLAGSHTPHLLRVSELTLFTAKAKKEQLRLIDCLAQDQCQKKLTKKRAWWSSFYWKEEK